MSGATSGTRVLLARHGEAVYETDRMVDAGGSLTARGRTQARALGRRLSGEGVTAAWCSTKARAVQTAELAAGRLGVEVTVREDLRELGPGDWFGDSDRGDPYQPLFAAWLTGDLEPGTPGGQSGREVAARMFVVLDEIADAHPDETVLVVSHGGAMLSVVSLLAPGAPGRPTRSPDVAECEVIELRRDDRGWHVPG